MDAAGNIGCGLRRARLPGGEIRRRVAEMLALVGLAGYEHRRVTELSGGEQQRVALARSLAPRPRLLMLDEPLAALDRALREQLMNDLRAILKRVGVTALYVTHDQEEAFAIGDRIVILRARPEAAEGGHVEQVGAPQDVYRRPASAYVARFLGFRNLLAGRVLGPWRAAADGRGAGASGRQGHAEMGERVETALGELVAADLARPYAAGERVTVLIRPEAAQLCGLGAGPNVFAGQLLEASFRGSYYLIRTGHAGGVTLTCEASAAADRTVTVGAAVALQLDPTAITLLAPDE
jgi:ABC-type Fe3+/spermidine/putrescine transport system ATPase subunit